MADVTHRFSCVAHGFWLPSFFSVFPLFASTKIPLENLMSHPNEKERLLLKKRIFRWRYSNAFVRSHRFYVGILKTHRNPIIACKCIRFSRNENSPILNADSFECRKCFGCRKCALIANEAEHPTHAQLMEFINSLCKHLLISCGFAIQLVRYTFRIQATSFLITSEYGGYHIAAHIERSHFHCKYLAKAAKVHFQLNGKMYRLTLGCQWFSIIRSSFTLTYNIRHNHRAIWSVILVLIIKRVHQMIPPYLQFICAIESPVVASTGMDRICNGKKHEKGCSLKHFHLQARFVVRCSSFNEHCIFMLSTCSEPKSNCAPNIDLSIFHVT